MPQSITCPKCQYGILLESSDNISNFNCPQCSFLIEQSKSENLITEFQTTGKTCFSITNSLSALINVVFIVFMFYMLYSMAVEDFVIYFILLIVLISIWNIYNLISIKSILLQANIAINAMFLLLFLVVGISLPDDNNILGYGVMSISFLPSLVVLFLKSKKK